MARILIVEDSPTTQKVLSSLVSQHGYDCDVVGTGEEALKAIAASEYSLIMMDIRLPGCSGFDAAKSMRTNGVRTPIVGISASSDAFDDDLCASSGINQMIPKALLEMDFGSAMERWLG